MSMPAGFDLTIDGTTIPAELPPMDLDRDVAVALASEVEGPAYAGLDEAGILDRLNATPLVPDPDPASARPAPLDPIEVLSAIPPEMEEAIEALPYYNQMIAAIHAQDRGMLGGYIALMARRRTPILTTGVIAALQAILARTVPAPPIYGPNWMQAHFPGRAIAHPDGSSAIGMVTLEMLHAARPTASSVRSRRVGVSSPAAHAGGGRA